MKYKFIFVIAVAVALTGASNSSQRLSPPIPDQNAHHWLVLQNTCETRCPVGGKEVTYGANEHVEGKVGKCWKVCQWKLVPYWPADRG